MPKSDLRVIEEALVDPTLDDEKLRALLIDAGFPPSPKPRRVFPVGIVVQDGIGAEFDVPQSGIRDFMDVVTSESVLNVRRVKIFPLGIPNDTELHGGVDRFRVQLQVGRRLG